MILANCRIAGGLVGVRILNGVIAEIGAPERAAGETVRDLEGRWLGPGLWDEHVHFTQWALSSQRVDLSGAGSAREAAALVRAALDRGAARGGMVVGAGFRDSLWADAPARGVLDPETSGIPTVLVSADLHSVWLNSPALAQFGHGGHPTGLLREEDAFDIEQRLGTMPDDLVDSWARDAAASAAGRGVVGIVDFEMAWNAGVWQRRVAHGHDALRVDFGIYTQDLDRAIAEGLRTGASVHDLLVVGPYKILSDGSLNTRTAYTHDAYPDEGGSGESPSHGQMTVPLDRLVPLMRTAASNGIVPAVHAIGDQANTIVLDAFEAVGGGGRIEHAQLLSESDIPRFAALGVQASVQPEHAMDDRDVAGQYWAGRTGRMFPFRALLDAGATLRFGSDAPVSPLDPWLGISAAVGRSRDGLEPWHPEQRISAREALAASSRTTLAVGQPADLIVTERDPLGSSHDQLRDMPVAATLLGGRFTHDGLS